MVGYEERSHVGMEREHQGHFPACSKGGGGAVISLVKY